MLPDFTGWTPEQIISYVHQQLGIKERTAEEWDTFYREQERKEREHHEYLRGLYETGKYLIYKRKCPVCGVEFYTWNSRRIYDDYYKCSRYVHRKNAIEKRKRERFFTECQECGRYFTPQRSDARYCCAACKQKAYRHRASGQSDHTEHP